MSIALPGPIAAYFAADQDKGDAVALCFAENAIVVDERRTHTGHDAIRRWTADAARKYSYVAEPFAADEKGDHAVVVTAHVVGNFPGSPVDLRYAFVLEGEQIARLEIMP